MQRSFYIIPGLEHCHRVQKWWTGQCRCHLHLHGQHSTGLMHDPLMWSICLLRNCKEHYNEFSRQISASLPTCSGHGHTPTTHMNWVASWTLFFFHGQYSAYLMYLVEIAASARNQALIFANSMVWTHIPLLWNKKDEGNRIQQLSRTIFTTKRWPCKLPNLQRRWRRRMTTCLLPSWLTLFTLKTLQKWKLSKISSQGKLLPEP